ncbi:MAG: hypothetical protein AAFP87_21165 [Pseudomonadota bacterium]
MNSIDIKLLKNYLSSLFIEFYAIPSYEAVHIVINNYLSECLFPAFGIAGILDIINSILKIEKHLKILSTNYTLGSIQSAYPNLDIYEEDKCLEFFKIVLKEEMVPMPQSLEILEHHCIHIVQYNECNETRVDEAISLLKKVRDFCENVKCIFPLKVKDIDAKHCDCYEYEMSNNCEHVDDAYS